MNPNPSTLTACWQGHRIGVPDSVTEIRRTIYCELLDAPRQEQEHENNEKKRGTTKKEILQGTNTLEKP